MENAEQFDQPFVGAADSEQHHRVHDVAAAHDWQDAQRMGITPSIKLRRHFVALARRVCHWSESQSRPVRVGVTSLERRVGKSTIAFNLSTALTRIVGEQVLLVEADFGKHFISRRLGSAGAPGLSEVIGRGADAKECILPVPLGELSVLPSGRVSEQDSVELPFDRLGEVLDQQLGQFEFLVFDLPVANDLTSCFSMLPHLDGVMVAVDAGRIEPKQIHRARKRLADLGVDLMGMVINCT